jgi:prepilin-type N-terminal cleavage/methylation domain-containing protein
MRKFKSTSVFNDRGFTLLEILIAITLLAFITIGVVSITQNAADTMDRTTEINKNNLQVETALSRFEWDFSQIYSPLYFSTPLNINTPDPYGASNDSNMDGMDDSTGQPLKAAGALSPALQEYYQRLSQRFEQNEHFSGVSKEGLPIPRFYSPEKNLFEFFTSSNRRKIENTRQSHFAWVRYTLGDPLPNRDDESEKEKSIPQGLRTFVRYFSADNPYDSKRLDSDKDNIKAAVLLENVESLEFQFWDTKTRKWETNLKTVQGGENSLRGVKINLAWYDSTGNKRTISRIYRNHWPMEVPVDTLATPTPAGGIPPGGKVNGDTPNRSTGTN